MGGMKPIIVIGTRPEAIKLAPVAGALPEADVVTTGQHPAEMVVPTLEYFGVPVAEKRNHIAGVGLSQSFGLVHHWLGERVRKASCVIAQGDTTTVAAAAMAAFYSGVPFVHVEAGLRTYDATPYPEEFNRRLCALAATVNCAPTEDAKLNLRDEYVPGSVYVTGNTVVDALNFACAQKPDEELEELTGVLITCHRRENAEHIAGIAEAVSKLALRFPFIRFIWCVHPNPAMRPPTMWNTSQITPPNYPQWVQLMRQSRLILTDSGGIQEEAAILGKPCLVLRESTEREEAVECGACRMVGTDPKEIYDAAVLALDGEPWPIRPHPFGDGHSGERIANIVRQLTNTEPCPPSHVLTATP